MTSRVLKLGLTLAATGAALALGAGSASAATTYTVTAGKAPVGTAVAITGVTQGSSPQIAFKDTTSGTALNCGSGTAPGSTKTGTGLAGTKIGTITGAKTTWNTCTGPLGLTLAVTGSGTWTINATGGNATTVTGTIAKVVATVNSTNPQAPCSFTVKGSVPISLNNTAQTLTVLNTKSLLTVSGVSGCFGLVNESDKASFSAVYKLTATKAAYNPVKIVPSA